MTDSTAKPPRESLDNFDNALDAMLDEAASSLEDVNALRDDEDAIDRLLMENGFDAPEEFAQTVGIKEKQVDDITLPEFDEFTGFDDELDDFEQAHIVQNDGDNGEGHREDDSFARVETDQPEAGSAALQDEYFAEIEDLDAFADDVDGQAAAESGPLGQALASEQGAMMQAAASPDVLDEDFLLANFDSSADAESELEAEPVADDLRGLDNAMIHDAFASDEPAQVPLFMPGFNDEAADIKQESRESPASGAGRAEMEALSQFKADQELINRQQKKRLQELDDKAGKAMVSMYAALALAGVSLVAAVSVGFWAEGPKTEAARLAGVVATLEQEVKSIAATPAEIDMTPINVAMEQLNQKVEDLAGQLGALGASSADSSQQELTDVISKQNMANKALAALQHKVDVLTAGAPVKSSAVKEASTQAAAVKPAAAKAPTPKKKMKKAGLASGADWSVNLLALREQRQADNKAAEFAKKGVPVEVVEVVVNKQPWYRLRVSGFNSQNEANAYAGRAKKALSLDSVWVTKK